MRSLEIEALKFCRAGKRKGVITYEAEPAPSCATVAQNSLKVHLWLPSVASILPSERTVASTYWNKSGTVCDLAVESQTLDRGLLCGMEHFGNESYGQDEREATTIPQPLHPL